MSEKFISLAGKEPFAVGNNRACYVHEAFPGKCLKVVLEVADSSKGLNREGGDDNVVEFRTLQKLHRWTDWSGRSLFPSCEGFVETDLGPALVTELFTDMDGKISLTLDHILAEGRFSKPIERAYEEFKRKWMRAGVRSRQIRLHNLIVQEVNKGKFAIKVIDGLGHKGGVFMKPFHLLLRWKARKKIRALDRKIAKFTGLSHGDQQERLLEIRQDALA